MIYSYSTLLSWAENYYSHSILRLFKHVYDANFLEKMSKIYDLPSDYEMTYDID